MAQLTKPVIAIIIVIVLIAATVSAYAVFVFTDEEEESPALEMVTISSDSELASSEFVTGGNGSASDPFIISDLRFQLTPSENRHMTWAMSISNIDAYFVIRNVTIRTALDPQDWYRDWIGIRFSSVTNGTIEFSRFENLTEGIRVEDSIASIRSNTFERCDKGIWLDDPSSRAELYGEEMLIAGNSFYHAEHCILARSDSYLGAVWGVRIVDNLFGWYEYGVLMSDGCFDFTISRNEFSGGGQYAISATQLMRSSIKENTVLPDGAGQGGGFFLYACNNLTVAGNWMYSVSLAMKLHLSKDISITGNHITNAWISELRPGLGIFIEDCTSVHVSGNEMHYTAVGLMLISSGPGNSEVWVFGNAFKYNEIQAVDNSGPDNHWDDGVGTGNYWLSDGGSIGNYEGIDADHDGIGDTPFSIDIDSADNYPLMESPV